MGKFIRRLKRFFKSYYCIKQHDMTDCGAACLVAIAKYYGLKKPISQIREIAGTDTKGTNALGMIRAAEKIGFEAKGVRAERDELTDELKFPLIAHLNKNGIFHYVVIYEVTKDEIFIADPAEGFVSYKPEDFHEYWTGVLILITLTDEFKKGDETTSFFTRFMYLILSRKKLVFEIFLSSVIYTLLGIVGAFYFKILIDDILTNNSTNTLHIITIGILGLRIFNILLGAFRRHLLLYLSQKIDISLVLNYYRHIVNLPMSFFDSRRVGEIVSRLGDASKIRSAISGATFSVMLDTLSIIFIGIVLYIQNSTLFMITLAYIPFYVAIVWGFSKYFKKIHREIMEKAADLNSYLVESLSGILTIKAFNAEEDAKIETEQRFIKRTKAIFKASLMNNIQNSSQGILGTLTTMGLLWVGATEVINGNISIGQLMAFNALLGQFLGPLQNLINLQPMLQEAFVAGDRLGEILDLEKETKGELNKIEFDNLKGKIEFKGVTFAYGTRKSVLEDINLKIEPGERIALVGESGSGKTTLVKLILKFYLPNEGKILIDDYNIEDIIINSLRSNVGYVPQDVFLFNGTVMENITFGLENVETKKVIEAAQKAQIHEFINELPLRYNTLIEEHGSNLSGGQKQRIAIARVILRNPDLLILDEATSNLDSTTERAIHNIIDELSQQTTTIIIAHRLSTIKNCDRIVVLSKGKIIEVGTHYELIKRKGFYYDLWMGQNGDNSIGEMII
ncbi:MAG: peptidase domain-containing ABC transporter [Halanaerobiales bacterium]|nr:peptidase domain-containing ABC transporter [Halanaerobiales bacterium]